MKVKERKTAIKPGMNVTPLVDVVLVLLIIFMVITPLLEQNFWVHLPPQEKKEVEAEQLANDSDYEALVLSVASTGQLKLNGNVVAQADLKEKLKRVFAARDDHVLFFDAADDAPYGTAVEALDAARGGGAISIAILTERPEGADAGN